MTAMGLPTILTIAKAEKWGHIAAIAASKEADNTYMVDLGFSCIDDALHLWTQDSRFYNG